MGDRSVQRLDDQERLSADADRADQVVGRERLDRAERGREPLAPPAQHHGARHAFGHLELAVTIAIGLLAVGREEVAEPRPQVPGDVLHDDGDAVRAPIELGVQIGVRRLRDRPVAERLVVAEAARDILQVRGTKIDRIARHVTPSYGPTLYTRPCSTANVSCGSRGRGGRSPASRHSPGGGSIHTLMSRPEWSRTASRANVPNAPTKLDIGSSASCSTMTPCVAATACASIVRSARSDSRAGST